MALSASALSPQSSASSVEGRSPKRQRSADDAPRLPLRRRQNTREPEPHGARAWLASAGQHPVLSAIGAVLTVVLPTRVASTLHSYAPHYNLVEDSRPARSTGSNTPGDDFGFFVAITPLTSPGAPFAGDRAFRSLAGGTPPLVGYKMPFAARKPGAPEPPPPEVHS